MKWNLTISFIFLIVFQLLSQNKQDYIWPFGRQVAGYRFNFNDNNFEIETRSNGVGIDSNNAMICDENGTLLFYTNGCAVMNRFTDVMPNGDSLNYNEWFEMFWDDCESFGYPGTQSSMILPDPANIDGYYLMQQINVRYPGLGVKDSIGLHHGYVDMTLDEGKGDVVYHNEPLHDRDNFMYAYLTAIRHSNGMDWWVINPLVEDSTFFTLLIDETGIHRQPDQNTHHFFYHPKSSASGTARFSPDGTKYAIWSYYDNLHVFDFDRSTGILSNHQKVTINEDPLRHLSVFGSVEWSPNSRFLYVTAQTTLHQIDMLEEDPNDGIRLIDTYNGTQDPFSTIFYLMALAPDCRIYMCPTSSTNSYHVINSPDKLGTGCNFVQNGIDLPVGSTVASMPNVPRWRVDEEEKCDSSLITSVFNQPVYYRRDLLVYPNPSAGLFRIDLPEDNLSGVIEVYDIQGKLMSRKSILDSNGTYRLDLLDYPPGTYQVEFYPAGQAERVFYGAQVVVVR